MIDYILGGAAGTPSAGAPIWARDFLQPLAPGALTPFSASVLHEMAGRSWFGFYDRLGFDPTPKSRVVRTVHGRPYFTLTLSAQLEAQHAGAEPPALRIGGASRPLARWEKPGLIAGLKLGGNARKLGSVLPGLAAEIDTAEPKGRAWLQRVGALHWSQAEILQIMEEIERTGAATLQLYVAARTTLQFAYLRLLGLLGGPAAGGPASAQQLAALNQALRPDSDLVELQIARAVAELAALAQADAQARRFLQGGDYAAWQEQLAGSSLAAGLEKLLAAHGHRAWGEGELMNPRWAEDPAPLLAAVAAAAACGASTLTSTGPDEGPFLALVDAKRRRDAQVLLLQARQGIVLQSKALHVHAYTLAGTRIWALAAGHEAIGDGRLLADTDVFFYELEEMKQMMTGEWNVSDTAGIRATAAERKAQWQGWRQESAGDLLVGDAEAMAAVPPAAVGLPGAGGAARGPLLAFDALAELPAAEGAATQAGKPILAGAQADVGAAVSLPAAGGLILSQGSPLDPIVAAAAALQIPVVYDLSARLATIQTQTFAAIDGSQGTVTQ